MIDITTTTTRMFHEQGISVEVTVTVKNDSTLSGHETVMYDIEDFDLKNGNSLTAEKAQRLARILQAAIVWDEQRKIKAG